MKENEMEIIIMVAFLLCGLGCAIAMNVSKGKTFGQVLRDTYCSFFPE